MDIKQELIKLRNKLIETKQEKYSGRETDTTPTSFVNIQDISLDAKVDDYIEWYFENMVKGQYTDLGEYWQPIALRNFIEKMAVWYELRYPDYEINRLLSGSNQEATKVSDVMFNSNRYINDLFDEDSDIRVLDWDEFYNTSAFIKSLPWIERHRLQRGRYKDLVYVVPNYNKLYSSMKYEARTAHLHLTSKGFVEVAEGFDSYTNFKITNKQLKGLHVKDVVRLLKENNITLPSDNELESAINNYEKLIDQKERLLDSVMYRIIERGGNRIGPRRGFLFAKEFKRNIDIPMMYAIDYSDPGLRLFINEYIKAGGSKDLMCYVGYFRRTNQTKKLDKISIQKLLLIENNCVTNYTLEETKLHQRIVDAIASQIDNEEIRKEEVKQLRLQRKLEKSKKANGQ